MLRRLRLIRPSTGLLVLVLFSVWLGVALLHHHGASPACEICKALQGAHATLPGIPPTLGCQVTAHRLPAVPLLAVSELRSSLHPVRAPPLA